VAACRLDINLDQLCFAAEHHTHEISFYLDTETGAVVSVRHDDGHLAEAFLLIYLDHGILGPELEHWLEQCVDDVQRRDAVRTAVMIEQQYGARYVIIPAPERTQCYADILAFVGEMEDPVLSEWLSAAIQGNGAFSRFRALLREYEHERDRWFAYRRARIRERMIEWLASVDVELTECDR